MLEILQFIFSSFWIWLGATIHLGIIFYLLIVAIAGGIMKTAAKIEETEAKIDDGKNDNK